jgi:hypothetical protein
MRAVTARGSMSFYVTASKSLTSEQRARATNASKFGDAVTLAGVGGPRLARELREGRYSGALLFDAVGYNGREVDSSGWAQEQRAIGADRILLPGRYIPWVKDDLNLFRTTVAEEYLIAECLDATMLLAVDSRWIANAIEVVIDSLACGRPVALVLADKGDPLERSNAASNLRRLVVSVSGTALLRSDHGGLVAAACGDGHTSIGLSSSTRHFVGSDMTAFKIADTSPRVFVRPLLDWFRGSDLAGWDAARVPIRCYFPCCDGGSLGSLYFSEDSSERAIWHNMHALADFADLVLNADLSDRPAVFREACEAAASCYGIAGVRGPVEMKSQLRRWVFS